MCHARGVALPTRTRVDTTSGTAVLARVSVHAAPRSLSWLLSFGEVFGGGNVLSVGKDSAVYVRAVRR
jgi:hypothetical protein